MNPSSARLKDKRILVTRPRQRAEEICFLLEEESAQVWAVPFLEMLPPSNPAPLQAAAENLHRYSWVLFTSPSGVEGMVEALRQAKSLSYLSKVRVGVVGPKTAALARSYGIEVSCEALQETGEGLFEVLKPWLKPGDEILLPVAQQARVELPQLLRDHGFEVVQVAAYRTEETALSEATKDQLLTSRLDAVIFASPKTALAFASALGLVEATQVLRQSAVVAIGPTTERALLAQGIGVAEVATHPTAMALVEAVVRALG